MSDDKQVESTPIHQNRRQSIGGNVVSASLSAVGFSTDAPNVRLIETFRPARHVSTMLAQSAWNYLPPKEFAFLSSRYDQRTKFRMRARRTVSRINTRRSDCVVGLSDYMGELIGSRTNQSVKVCPVTLPLDTEFINSLENITSNPVATTKPFALVPGTVTLYKRPEVALDIVRSLYPEIRIVRFGGRTPFPELKQALEDKAETDGLEVQFGALTRHEMVKNLRTARVTILPSALESLGISVAEALLLSPAVIASPIPPHREAAKLAKRQPAWIAHQPNETQPPKHDAGPADPREIHERLARARDQWSTLGRTLNLPKSD